MNGKELIEKEVNKDKVGDEIANALVKSALGAIPFAGTFLNEAIFDARGRLEQRRINEFVGYLAEDFQKLDENVLKKENMGL